MTTLAILGWLGCGITLLTAYVEGRHARSLLEQKNNALHLWRHEAQRLAELAADRERTIAHMHMEIEALTPRRNARGKFVAKDAEL